MRYGHMVRKHDTSLLLGESAPVRKFAPLSKHATTAALDIRTIIRSFRGPRLVLAIIVAPFILALFAAIFRTRNRRPHPATGGMASVPETFQKFQYEAIRERGAPSVQFRVKILLPYFHKALAHRRKFKIDPQRSISLIAACKNRKESLALALSSWEGVKEVDEIVLVDWGSDSHDWQDLPLLNSLVKSGRVSFIQVQKAGDWILTRAYNLAAKFAVGKYLLRVDCDTHLNPNFIKLHPIPELGKYYSVGWGTERNENERRLRGVWFASKADFDKAGGYDERIISYGYEDLDLYERLHKYANIEAKFLDLNSLRHNVAADIVFQHGRQNITTANEISIRMNKQIIKTSVPWLKLHKAGKTMEYSFAYSRSDGSVFASIVRGVPDPMGEKTDAEREALKTEVLRIALHDEFNIPWDIIPSFTLKDLEYLANYLGQGADYHVLVVCLDGPDAISNVFNLVSAVELGISLKRPVIAIWRGLDGITVDQSDGPLLRQLFDLEATNALLQQVPLSDIGKKRSLTGSTRLIAAKAWPCVEMLSACAEKYDKAYESFSELELSIRHVYDESDPVPLRVRRNGLVKLSNKTKIGEEEMRAVAFKSLVQSHMVRVEQKHFPLEPDLGIVSDNPKTAARLAIEVQTQYSSWIAHSRDLPAIVGARHHGLRRKLFGVNYGVGFCERERCSAGQVAREVANVLAICNAVRVYPGCEGSDRNAWASRKDITSMMVDDLRILQRKY